MTTNQEKFIIGLELPKSKNQSRDQIELKYLRLVAKY